MALTVFDSPVGILALQAEDGAITKLYLPGGALPGGGEEESALLRQGREQVLEYLSGKRRTFDLPLAPAGTPFQRSVWRALLAIPYGETRSYRDIALDVGRPRAVRAVGQANHHNPIPILIPCHRVVGADGTLTGYAGGLALKEELLRLEAGAAGKERSPGL